MRACQRFACGGHFVDKAQAQTFGRAGAPAGKDHAHGLLQGDLTHQAFQATCAGDKAHARFAECKLRRLIGHDHVASQGDLKATAQGKTVHRSDDGFDTVGACCEPRVTRARRPHAPPAGHGLQVGASAKGLGACACDDGHPQRVVGLKSVEDLLQLVVGFRRDGVVGVGAMDGHFQHMPKALHQHMFVAGLQGGAGQRDDAVQCSGAQRKVVAALVATHPHLLR